MWGEGMYIDGNTIIQIAALAGALGTLGVLVYKIVQWLERQKQQDEEIKNIKEEQGIICWGLLATLDGLKQLGANGNVSEVHKQLEKHLNKSAHDTTGK